MTAQRPVRLCRTLRLLALLCRRLGASRPAKATRMYAADYRFAPPQIPPDAYRFRERRLRQAQRLHEFLDENFSDGRGFLSGHQHPIASSIAMVIEINGAACRFQREHLYDHDSGHEV